MWGRAGLAGRLVGLPFPQALSEAAIAALTASAGSARRRAARAARGLDAMVGVEMTGVGMVMGLGVV